MSHLLRSLWESFELYEIQQSQMSKLQFVVRWLKMKKMMGLQNSHSFDRYTRTTSFILPPAFLSVTDRKIHTI